METSILDTIRRLIIGVDKNQIIFDPDLIVFINSAFMRLNQLGVGPSNAFSITSDEETWQQFMGGRTDLEAVKSYIYLKVRLIFDPPQSGVLLDAIKQEISEHEFSLLVQA